MGDEVGTIKAVGVKRLEPTGVEVAEAEAARYGMDLARRLGYSRIILECDAFNVVQAISMNARGFTPTYLFFFFF
ncbi:Inter-alpha-trypsin inhibitor heavy chain H4 [Bienertia sinuspersici]